MSFLQSPRDECQQCPEDQKQPQFNRSIFHSFEITELNETGSQTGATMALAAMMEEVDRYCVDEKLTVTYQWLSRKLDVASDVSKRCVPPAAPAPLLLAPGARLRAAAA
eukprot:COSAG06_NODE_81_length_25302_cov_21.168902_17_plen_109_part_00